MEWMPPERSIDQKQMMVINQIEAHPGNCYWVKGFAGSGKTVILVQFIKRFLSRPENANKTVCFITFTHALKDLVTTGFPASMLSRFSIMTHTRFISENRGYDLVVLDEVQDIPPRDLRFIKGKTDWLVVAGDSDQRIYENGAQDDEINFVLMDPRSEWLIKIYRMTRKLCQVAKIIFPRAKMELSTASNLAIKAGADVYIRHFESRKVEAVGIWLTASNAALPGRPVVILLPKHTDIKEFTDSVAEFKMLGSVPRRRKRFKKFGKKDVIDYESKEEKEYYDFNEFWRRNNVNLQYLGNGNGSFDDSERKPMVYIMTYHSSKGLDFRNVYIPFLDDKIDIFSRQKREKNPDLERKLFYVASTRSREMLCFSYSGNRPNYLLKEIIDKGVLTQSNQSSDDDEEDYDTRILPF